MSKKLKKEEKLSFKVRNKIIQKNKNNSESILIQLVVLVNIKILKMIVYRLKLKNSL